MSAGTVLSPASAALAVTPVTEGAQTIDPVMKMARQAHDRALDRHIELIRDRAQIRGEDPDAAAAERRREVRDWSIVHLRERNRELRRENRRLRAEAREAQEAAAARAAAAASAPTGTATGTTTAAPGNLEGIAACESGGDPSAVDATGTYRGKYQFDQQTWQSVGGSGDPAAAPEAVQDQMAARLYAQRGSAPWPVCG